MAAVMMLQALQDYSDRETAEAVRFDVRWKRSDHGASLDDPGFDPSSLVYWRNRIAKSSARTGSTTRSRRWWSRPGVLKGRAAPWAVDSTILADAVATQDTDHPADLGDPPGGPEVPGAAEQIAAVCTGHDYSSPGKPKVGWDDPAAKVALVSALVNDACALVAALAGRDLEESPSAAAAVALLALVAGQDVHGEPRATLDGTRRAVAEIARKVAEDRVISVTDPDARHTRKSPGGPPRRVPGACGRRPGHPEVHHR